MRRGGADRLAGDTRECNNTCDNDGNSDNDNNACRCRATPHTAERPPSHYGLLIGCAGGGSRGGGTCAGAPTRYTHTTRRYTAAAATTIIIILILFTCTHGCIGVLRVTTDRLGALCCRQSFSSTVHSAAVARVASHIHTGTEFGRGGDECDAHDACARRRSSWQRQDDRQRRRRDVSRTRPRPSECGHIECPSSFASIRLPAGHTRRASGHAPASLSPAILTPEYHTWYKR